MKFNQKVIELKTTISESIHINSPLLSEVLHKEFGEGAQLQKVTRAWSPGGGASLYKVITDNECFFLKFIIHSYN